jgi:hydroxyacylglutathione hydrolase
MTLSTPTSAAGSPVAAHPSILPIPAFDDNYIWMIIDRDQRRAAVVDPGDAAPVLAALRARGLHLSAILVTHHHGDHVGGLDALQREYPEVAVHGPQASKVAALTHRHADGARLALEGFDVHFTVMNVPGHTLDHIAWYAPSLGTTDPRPVLFCGDTLFVGGCGRVFEGTPAQMHASLSRLAALPASTLVYCAHEYTASNLRFALLVEPGNSALQARAADVSRLREAGTPTVPSTIGDELATNPFLRAAQPAVRQAAAARLEHAVNDEVAVFAAIRGWKDVAR